MSPIFTNKPLRYKTADAGMGLRAAIPDSLFDGKTLTPNPEYEEAQFEDLFGVFYHGKFRPFASTLYELFRATNNPKTMRELKKKWRDEDKITPIDSPQSPDQSP